MSSYGFPVAYVTPEQAAQRLGVSPSRVSIWLREARLPVALLDGEIVDRLGPKLAAEAPRFEWAAWLRRRRPRRPQAAAGLRCGCLSGMAPGRLLDSSKACADALALDAARRFTTALADAMPDDEFLRRLAEAARIALERHLGGAETIAVAPMETAA